MRNPGCRIDPSRFTSMEYDCELDSIPSCCMSSSSLSSFDEPRYPLREPAPLVFCIKLPKKKCRDKKCCCCNCCCCCCHSRCCCCNCCNCCCNRCCCNCCSSCCCNCCSCCCNCCCKKKKSCCAESDGSRAQKSRSMSHV